MKQRLIYAALTVLTLCAPVTVVAQTYQAGSLPAQEILDIVRDGGFDPLGQPLRRGPNYVLRAVDGSDREVRVVINARSGDIVSVTPVTTAARVPPGGSMGPYERMAPGYVPPGPPAAYRNGPPVVYEDDEPVYGRPRVPSAPPASGFNAPTQTPAEADEDDAALNPRPLHSTEIPPPAGQDGLLPPPPERFPQRAAPPIAKPKPVKRAAVTPPKSAPLPKPRPASSEPPPSAEANAPPPANDKSDEVEVPH